MGEEGGAKIDSRVKWVLSRCAALQFTSPEKMDKFFSAFNADEASNRALGAFLDVPEVTLRFCYPSTPSQLKKKVLVMHRRIKEVEITAESIQDAVIMFELNKNLMDVFNAYCHSVCLPLLTNPAKQRSLRWSDLITKDLMDKYHVFLANLHVTVGLMKGHTWLPQPPKDALPTGGAALAGQGPAVQMGAKDRVHVLEGAVITWTKQIRHVLKQDPEMLLKDGKNPQPNAELAFWKSKATSLSSILSQLGTDGLKKVFKFLETNKSTYTAPFQKLQKEVEDAREQALDNQLYLKALQKYIDKLMADSLEFEQMDKQFSPLMHTILLIWKYSKYYNTATRLAVLIREICNTVINNAMAYISGPEIFNMIASEEAQECFEKLERTLNICTAFKDTYVMYRDLAEKEGGDGWKTNDALFVRLDAFRERCRDALDFTRIVMQYTKCERIVIGRTKGKLVSESVVQIHEEFMAAVEEFRSVSYDIMDVGEQTLFDIDFLKFRIKVKDLDQRLGTLSGSAFDDLDTMQNRLKTFDNFEDVRGWPLYKWLMDEAKNMNTVLLFVNDLHGETMRDRHWASLMTVTQKNFDKGPEFCFRDLGRDVGEVVDQSVKEAKIEKKLNIIKNIWSKMEVTFDCSNPDCPLLGDLSEIFERLDGDSLEMMGMTSHGRFIEFCKPLVDEWSGKLRAVDGALGVWQKVQENWLRLEPIFMQGDDIRSQLPVDAKLFETMDAMWKDLMTDASQSHLIVEICMAEGREDALKAISEGIESCEKALNEYLDQKKKILPRFYFCANQAQLDISSNGNRPLEVNEYLGDIFDGVKSLDYKKALDTGRIASGHLSKDAETFEWAEDCLHCFRRHTAQPQLVLPSDCTSHVVCDSSVFRQSRENSLPMGVGGSGRSRCARPYAGICEASEYDIALAKVYGLDDFREDEKKLLIAAGSNETLMKELHKILNSGEGPNVFPSAETERTIGDTCGRSKEYGFSEASVGAAQPANVCAVASAVAVVSGSSQLGQSDCATEADTEIALGFLPPGWEAIWSAEWGMYCYADVQESHVQWQPPPPHHRRDWKRRCDLNGKMYWESSVLDIAFYEVGNLDWQRYSDHSGRTFWSESVTAIRFFEDEDPDAFSMDIVHPDINEPQLYEQQVVCDQCCVSTLE